MLTRIALLSGVLVTLLGAGPSSPRYARVQHPISSSSATAQARFDQGLTLLYAFSRSAARRAFYGAAAADPRLAMAYWGVAMSYGSNINLAQDAASERAAYAAIRKALALSTYAKPAERDYVKALAVRFSSASKPDYDALARAYHDAMRALARKYPDDLDAVTLYAESGMDLRPWDLYANSGAPRPDTEVICATLESVLRRDPEHIGANHFYVHATEASLHPERALQSAGRLASMNFEPAAAHLTHMPAHTFARTGYYEAASGSNVLATEHDRKYLGYEGRHDREASLYYDHDLAFLAYGEEMDGDRSGALGTMARLNGEGAQVPAMFVLLRFQRWDDILALPRPKPDQAEPMRLVIWRFARGMAFAGKGNLGSATRERSAMDAAGNSLHLPAIAGFTNSSDKLVGLADEVVAARIAEARLDLNSEIPLLRAAVRTQDELIYIEPPDWYYPVRESLGGALLRAGRPAEAAQVFRDDLSRDARNPRSLFGLSKALAALGNTEGAQRRQRQFQDAWKHADVKLTLKNL
jgi:tetratricopeptide (TPR) repeat protein